MQMDIHIDGDRLSGYTMRALSRGIPVYDGLRVRTLRRCRQVARKWRAGVRAGVTVRLVVNGEER